MSTDTVVLRKVFVVTRATGCKTQQLRIYIIVLCGQPLSGMVESLSRSFKFFSSLIEMLLIYLRKVEQGVDHHSAERELT
jgi:hypothetical protein